MMEKPHSGKAHNHSVLITLIDDKIIPYGSARFCDVCNAALLSPVDIVAEREECVTTECYARDRIEICLLLFLCKRCRTLCEILLPVAVGNNILALAGDVLVDHVIPVGTSESIKERKFKYPVPLTECPVISLVSGKSCTMHS